MSAHQFTDEHRILFIDQQANFDLAAGAISEPSLSKTNEALRRALRYLQGHL